MAEKKKNSTPNAKEKSRFIEGRPVPVDLKKIKLVNTPKK